MTSRSPDDRSDTPASQLVLAATRIRAEAAVNDMIRNPDPLSPGDRRYADELEARALAKPEEQLIQIGAGGELIPAGSANYKPLVARNTVNNPNYVTVEASRSRVQLADECRVLETALDLAQTIQAENSIEKMLAEQMAMLHSLAMRTGKHAIETTDRLNGIIDSKLRDTYTVQHQRLNNSAARASAEFQNCALTLQRLRTGGKQSITVIHQNTLVNDGGQAVVTAGGRGRKHKGLTNENG